MKTIPYSTGLSLISTVTQCELWPCLAASCTREDLSRLTERENQIVGMLFEGKIEKQIATELGISAWTVDFHLRNLRIKTASHSTREVLIFFVRKATA